MTQSASATGEQESEAPWHLFLRGETVRLIGPTGAWLPGVTSGLVLAYLALEGPTPRERLAGLLWPERPDARARANLRQLLLRIREAAPIVRGDPVRLDADVWVDARALPDEAIAGTAGGGLLAGVDASRWPALAEWLASRRSDHDARVRQALLDGISAARQDGDLAAAAAAAERLTHLDPWSEAACRTVMEVALAQREPAAALRAFRRLRRTLAHEVGSEPGVETVALAARAAREAAQLPSAPPRQTMPSSSVAQHAESGGWLREGAELLLRMAEELPEGLELGRLLAELAWLEHRLGWNRRARTHAGRALEVSGDASDHAPEAAAGSARADAWFVLGSLAWAEGDLVEARDRWDRALQSLRLGDRAARLRLSLDLALVEDALARPGAARRHYLAALALARATAERTAEAKILNNLGAQLVCEGRAPDGLALLRRAHALAREHRDRLLEGYVLDSLAGGYLAVSAAAANATDLVADDRLAAARAAAARAAHIGIDAGDARLQIEALLTLSRVSLAEADGAAARRFAEAALARAEASGWQPLSASARLRLVEARAQMRGRDAGVTAGG